MFVVIVFSAHHDNRKLWKKNENAHVLLLTGLLTTFYSSLHTEANLKCTTDLH